jgi:hypothetical protein
LLVEHRMPIVQVQTLLLLIFPDRILLELFSTYLFGNVLITSS